MAELDFSKFEGLFKSMERQLVMQTSFLESMYNMSVEEREDRNRRESNERLERVSEYTRESAFNQPLDQRTQQQVEPAAGGGLLASILGGIPGMLSNISLGGAGKLMLKGGIAAMIAPAVGEFVAGFVTKGLDELDYIPEEFKQGLANSLGDAANAGVIGSIFGKKYAAIFAGGSLLGDAILAAIGGDANQKIIDAFGVQFNAGDVSQIGSTAALMFGPSLFESAFSALPEDASFRQKFVKGFSGKLIKGGGLALLGETVAMAIEGLTGSKELGDVASWTGYGASLGSMFGPTGTLIGAIAGFAIGAGFAIDKYAQERAQSAYDDSVKKIDELSAATRAAVESGDVDAAVKNAKEALNSYQAVVTSNGINSIDLAELGKKEENLLTALAALQQLDKGAYDLLSGQAEDLRAQASFGKGAGKEAPLEKYVVNTIRSDLTQEQIQSLDEDTLKGIIEQTIDSSTIAVDMPTRDKITEKAYSVLTNSAPSVGISELTVPQAARIDVQPRLAPKVTQLEQDAMESRRQAAAANVVVGGATTVGGSTTNNNNQSTIVNNYVRPEVALDHYLP